METLSARKLTDMAMTEQKKFAEAVIQIIKMTDERIEDKKQYTMEAKGFVVLNLPFHLQEGLYKDYLQDKESPPLKKVFGGCELLFEGVMDFGDENKREFLIFENLRVLPLENREDIFMLDHPSDETKCIFVPIRFLKMLEHGKDGILKHGNEVKH